MSGVYANVIGFDDAPFPREHRGDVRLVGTVCSRTRLDGVLSSRVRRDGRNSTETMIAMIEGSAFAAHVQAVLLQGIAVAGFNVVDVHALHEALGRPVLVVARRQPNLTKIKRTLLQSIPGGARKWRLIERLGDMEPLRQVYVQRVGLDRTQARNLLAATTLHGNLPEPLRLAHLIAGGVTTGHSRGRA
ncbi:MAG: DUF99 family protein [Myxococcales bacterium]|nr:DUF99 family protein [Myxococcales bacterium]